MFGSSKNDLADDLDVYMAAHVASTIRDGGDPEGRTRASDDGNGAAADSFLDPNFNDFRFREQYGMNRGAFQPPKQGSMADVPLDLNASMTANSESAYYQKEVKRQNLVKLFLDGMEVEKYISTHLYGAFQEAVDDPGDSMNQSRLLQSLINTSHNYGENMWDMTLLKNRKIAQKETSKIQKMTGFQTYIALVKGYCGACVLFTPKAFANGGWLFSSIAMCIAGAITSICAYQLIELGHHYRSFNYSDIVKQTFGNQGRRLLDFMIFSTQYIFTISSIVFQATNIRDMVLLFFYGPGYKEELPKIEAESTFDVTNIWTYGAVIVVLLTLLAWVRNIAKFRFTFIFANFLLLSMVIIICFYSIAKLMRDGLGPGVEAVNTSGMWSMVGFSIYTFEGIGILMPCMQACDCPEKFNRIQIAAVGTVTVSFIFYGTLAYLAYGNMEAQMVTQILPQQDLLVKMLTILLIVILVLSYPLTVSPANATFEAYFIDPWFKHLPSEMNCSPKQAQGFDFHARRWMKNLSRFFICLSAAFLGIELSQVLDKFLGLMGALFCAPLALMTPTLCHLKVKAKTKKEKLQDLGIIVISTMAVVLCVATTVAEWKK